MSNIAIKGATTGTGVFTLESPATNTDRTLVLPDEAGTVLTSAGVPASAMPAGSVLQVVSKTFSEETSTTSYSFVAIGGSDISITPTSVNSKILVVFNSNPHMNTAQNSGSAQEMYLTVFRGGVDLGNSDRGIAFCRRYGDGALNHYGEDSVSMQVIDSPNTTNEVTYTAYYRSNESNETVGYSYNSNLRTVWAMEIAG